MYTDGTGAGAAQKGKGGCLGQTAGEQIEYWGSSTDKVFWTKLGLCNLGYYIGVCKGGGLCALLQSAI